MIDDSIHYFDDADETPIDNIAPTDISNVGISITLPSFSKWKGTAIYDYENQIADYGSLEELGEAISQARTALFLLTDQINKYEREERLAKIHYEREFRREFITSTEKTDAAKRARAALKCEELENEWVKYEQLKNELVRMSYAMRTELQTLQTIANNLRQQLKIM